MSIPHLRRCARGKCIPLPCSMCFSLIWVIIVAASTPQKIVPKATPSSVTSVTSSSTSGDGTGRIQNRVLSRSSNSTSIPRVPNTINADDIIYELISGFCGERESGGGGGEDVEGVYKSTQLYTSPIVQTPTPHTPSRRQKVKKSHLKREGASLLKAVTTLASRTTHGVCRAVNVTGTAASVVTGGVFKLAGAAVLDAVDGLEYASGKSPTEVPGVTEAYRFLAKGLRTTGEVMYDFGVAAENMTAEATEAAEETIRTVLDSVIETASGAYVGESSSNGARSGQEKSGYFAKEEDRIIDDMMFGTSYAGVDERGRGDDAGDDVMGYVEGDLSMDDEWARGGQRGSREPKRDRKEQKGNGVAETKAAALAARVREAIRRSILRSSRAVPSMRFPQMLACGLVFAVRGLTSNPWCGAASLFGARMYLKFVESIYLDCLKERMMSDIKFEAVARLHEGSPERARWFNTAVSAMWLPMLEPLLARWTSRQIARGIERSLPSNVSWVGLGKVTLGPRPPKIRYVQVQNVTSLAARKSTGQESNSVIDSVLLEVGQPGSNVKAEHVVYLELGVDWTSYRSKVSLRLGEQSRRRNWWSVTSYVPSYRVKLCDLGIKAKVIVALAVGEGRPFVKRLWVGFAEPPLTHLSLEALTGMDIANLPVLRNHLRHVVMRCLTPLTEPRHLAIQMKPPANPPSAYRGAALAARVRPAAAAGVRRGVLSRVPAFGLRRLLRNRSRMAAAVASASASAAAVSTTMEALAKGENEEDLLRKNDLEEATRRLLVDVGGECREETVMAAAAAMRGGDPWHLMSVGELSPLTSLTRDSRQLADEPNGRSGDHGNTTEQEDRGVMDGDGRKGERLRPRAEPPVAEKCCCAFTFGAPEAKTVFAAAAVTREETAAPVSSGEGPTSDPTLVAVVEPEASPHSCVRRDEETHRHRAALRENRDALSPGGRGGDFARRCRSCLRFTRLQQLWRWRRRKRQRPLFGKMDPEVEDIIRRVCLLSRPPPDEI